MYKQTLNLQDHEKAAILDEKTGEVKTAERPRSKVPEGKMLHEFKRYHKVNDRAAEFLEQVLSNEEMGVVMKMVRRADYESNIMPPLSDELSLRELEKILGVNREKVKKTLDKLFSLGVYAHVRVANGLVNEYWTLNPYIAWSGRLIEKSIDAYFRDTIIARASA